MGDPSEKPPAPRALMSPKGRFGPNRVCWAPQNDFRLLLNIDLDFVSLWGSFWVRLWFTFASSKCLPFGTLFAFKNNQKNVPKLDCSKSRSKIAPRPPKGTPRLARDKVLIENGIEKGVKEESKPGNSRLSGYD